MSLVGKLFVRKAQHTLNIDEVPAIFVAVVAYCDSKWLDYAMHLMDTAAQPGRIFFGIVEYVRKAEDSREADIPPRIRGHVRAHAMSERVATSVHEAREQCFNELFKDETFVLFSRSILPAPNWDDILINMLPPHAVLSFKITRDYQVVFPCIQPNGKVMYRPIVVSSNCAIPSLLWIDDFCFLKPDKVPLMLSSSNPWDVTATLLDEGVIVVVPGTPIAVRGPHPRGVKSASRAAGSAGAKYRDAIGAGEKPTARAQLGLTPDAEASEIIGKCGSLVAARVEIQTLEAEERRQTLLSSKSSWRVTLTSSIAGLAGYTYFEPSKYRL